MNIIPNLLAAIEEVTDIKPTPFSSRKPSTLPCISYTVYMQSCDRVTESWRLQVRITSEDLETSMELQESIANELCTLGDEGKHGALKIEINGGGTVEDELTHLPQLLTYFEILTEV